MQVAIVHELLTRRGGAESVAKIFADMFPDAPIYTLLYNEEKLGEWFPKDRVRTSNIQNSIFNILPKLKYNHHLYLSQFPEAVESWDFSAFDLILSSSSAFAHGIITNGKPKHLCYVHSPARYLWDNTHEVLERAGKGLLGPLKRWHLERTFHRLRVWDAEVAPRPDHVLANSKEVQRRIELYWGRESDVLYPPIDDAFFDRPGRKVIMERPDYFLIVSTLTPYKRIDIAIDACMRLNVHLKIVGEGPARTALERSAGLNIEFYGYRENDELRDLYASAQAVIFPGHDDFGLVPVEAMASGTPVIAYKAGGALETVIEGKTGTFFSEPTAQSLEQTLRSFDRKHFDANTCRDHAKQFSRTSFEQGIQKHIDRLL